MFDDSVIVQLANEGLAQFQAEYSGGGLEWFMGTGRSRLETMWQVLRERTADTGMWWSDPMGSQALTASAAELGSHWQEGNYGSGAKQLVGGFTILPHVMFLSHTVERDALNTAAYHWYGYAAGWRKQFNEIRSQTSVLAWRPEVEQYWQENKNKINNVVKGWNRDPLTAAPGIVKDLGLGDQPEKPKDPDKFPWYVWVLVAAVVAVVVIKL